MVTVEIRGKEFPLCLTVAAVDAVNAKCGSLKRIDDFLDGVEPGCKPDFGKALYNTAWLLGLLIQEGEENRVISARLSGETVQRRTVPDPEAMCHYLTVVAAKKYRKTVLDAVYESMVQNIEAEHPKNGDHAEQK